MKTEKVKVSAIKSNPNNPRIIKDENFQKLVQSIKDFPQMLEIRPIVVNKEMIVLGGNMRLNACIEAGVKELTIIKANNLTPEQEREFIIKDNSSFGEWDWDVLANEWDEKQLEEWGVEVPKFLNNFDTTLGGESLINQDVVIVLIEANKKIGNSKKFKDAIKVIEDFDCIVKIK